MATRTVRKPYVPRRSALWWTKNPRYLLYQLRELSSVFVLVYAFLVLWQLWALRGGEAAYDAFLQVWYSRPVVILNVIILGFALLHSVTWFSLTTKVPLFRIRGRPPPAMITVGIWVALWVVLSIVVLKFIYGWI